ncbi:MAG: chloride channel protein [Dehalococcoidales bacterium]|nr:chloride channel protein [Dehalococcoidales bacterium]
MREIVQTISKIVNPEHVRYLRKWLAIAVFIGIVVGIGSILFYLAIDWATWLFLGQACGYTPPSAGGEGMTVFSPAVRRWMIPVVCAVGGLISGFIVFRWAPEAEGHGTDAAINSFHNKDGFIRRSVPIVKLLASSITIGSGGSAGREGPVALIGAGFGSILADVLKLNASDRRIALAVGLGAGIGAIFKAPLGGALISAEILYRRDFEFEALFPAFIASIVGYSIFASWHGWDPIFSIETAFAFSRPQELLGYVILGIICGLFGILYGRTFYGMRDMFRSLKIPNYIKPAIGGLIVGIIGMFLPQILGMGYGWLQFAIDGNIQALPVWIMVAVIFGKIAATGLSVGSGGSGGVFAPGLVIGGMIGGATWSLLHGLVPIFPSDPAPFVVLGMMTLFGGIAKAPLAIMIMVSEMTGNYSLLIPSMVSGVIAYFLTGNSRIYENQVDTRAESPAHHQEYSVTLLEKIRIADAMVEDPVTASSYMLVIDLVTIMRTNRLDAVPVVDSGKLTGVVAKLDVARLSEDKWLKTRVSEIMTRKLTVGYAHETLYTAFTRMTKNNISHLPVVDPYYPDRMVGFLAIHDIALTYGMQKKTIFRDKA